MTTKWSAPTPEVGGGDEITVVAAAEVATGAAEAAHGCSYTSVVVQVVEAGEVDSGDAGARWWCCCCW